MSENRNNATIAVDLVRMLFEDAEQLNAEVLRQVWDLVTALRGPDARTHGDKVEYTTPFRKCLLTRTQAKELGVLDNQSYLPQYATPEEVSLDAPEYDSLNWEDHWESHMRKGVAVLELAWHKPILGGGYKMSGIDLIAQERERQISELNRDAAHDQKWTAGELAKAAARYAWPHPRLSALVNAWPWPLSWWHPTPNDRITELAKAGALIAAEIDRLQALNKRDVG